MKFPLWYGLALVLALGLASCESNVNEDPIPEVLVNEQLNITSLRYQGLSNIGGHIVLPDAGYRGIIVYRVSTDEFRAFDQACSYQPTSTCALVQVDESSLFMADTCCESTFDFNGFPTGGPALWPLRTYPTYLDGDILAIQN